MEKRKPYIRARKVIRGNLCIPGLVRYYCKHIMKRSTKDALTSSKVLYIQVGLKLTFSDEIPLGPALRIFALNRKCSELPYQRF